MQTELYQRFSQDHKNCQRTNFIVARVGQAPTTISQIAKELGMSVSKFSALFKAHYGESFYSVSLSYRMTYAAKLLKKGYKCNDVSEQVGYGEKSSIKFNKMFQKHFGTTPKKYQMEHHGSLNGRKNA